MKKYYHPDYNYVSIVEIDKHEVSKYDFAACREPRETLGSYYNRQATKPDVIINAGFFALANGTPVFNTVDEGVIRSFNNEYREGIGITTDGEIKFGLLNDGTDWRDFLSGYPVLIKGNGPINSFSVGSEINYNACRSILGINNDTVYLIHIGKPGMRFSVMSNILYHMGVTYAINLDGGGSARMLVNGSVFGYPTENRSVDNVFCVYLKKVVGNTVTEDDGNEIVGDAPYVWYTVQSGDSWWKIAQTQMGKGSRYQELMSFNNVKNSFLYAGMKIKIPTNEKIYTVNPGDSWWGIAAKELGNGMKYNELIKYNNRENRQALHPGEKIKIPV